MRKATIAASYAMALFDLAVSKGADRAFLEARCGIGPDDLANENQRVAFGNYVKLMRAAKESTRDPALALHFGETFDVGDTAILGLIGRTSETFLEVWQQINRFQRLGVDIVPLNPEPFVISREPRGTWVIDTRAVQLDFPELTEAFFARVLCGQRRLMGMPIAREIHFKHGDPGYRDEYDRIFQAPIFFNADKNAILFDNAVLTFRNPLASRHAARVLGDKAESLLRLLERSTTTRGEVERLLAPELSARRAGMGSIAQTMGVSRKTLFRRLKAEGVTFEHVQDELRREIALDHLTLRNASVNETAYLVGFSDPAAFSRAFKRWTGMSPRTARQVLSRADGTFERAAGMRPTSLSREGRLDA